MNERVNSPSSPPSAKDETHRKAYVKPEVRLLGKMSDRTLGNRGSLADKGHNRVTRRK
jgi:hypothetical protein